MQAIWMVDDHPVVRAGYARWLEGSPGLRVTREFGDAPSALNALREAAASGGLPQVLVTDLSLPGLGGLDLLRQVRERWPALPVLIFSMHDSAALVQRAFDGGARGFVSKDSPPDTLLAALEAVLAGRTWLDPGLDGPDLARAAVADEMQRLSLLTEREFAVFRLLAQGRSPAECAQALHLSAKTVSNYQSLIRDKLGLATTGALVHMAMRCGVVGGAPEA